MDIPGPVTLLDGSMGQELINRGAAGKGRLWSAGALFDAPATVRDIHEEYIRAGADIITTNSYSTIRSKFEPAGLMDRFAEMNRLAGQLAVEARDITGAEVLIAGSLPPQRGSYNPGLVGPFNEIEPLYREQAELLAPFVDLFLCETLSTAEEARAAASGAASTGKPVWVSWTLEDGGLSQLRSGETLGEAYARLDGIPVRALLVNCSMPESLGAAIPKLKSLGPQPVGVYANAFTAVSSQWVFTGSGALPPARTDLDPEAYAGHALRWIESGAQIIGGCCGVGPLHIARLRELDALSGGLPEQNP